MTTLELKHPPTVPHSGPSPSASPHFRTVDALRGIAALGVLFSHMIDSGDFSQAIAPLPSWLPALGPRLGEASVAIFFVLSGFVMAHSLRRADRITWSYFGRFSLRRWLRLSPIYYASLVICLAIQWVDYRLTGSSFILTSEPQPVLRILAHLLYLEDITSLGGISPVYWTLCLEMQFYLTFCAFLGLAQWLERRWQMSHARAIVFGSVTALFTIARFHGVDGRFDAWFIGLQFSFLLGVFAYWVWQHQFKAYWLYGYGALLIVAPLKDPLFNWISILIAFLLLEAGRRQRIDRWLKERPFQFLGRISYSLYVIHCPVMGAVTFGFYKFLGHSVLTDRIGIVVVISSVLIAASILWYGLERPSIRWSQSIRLTPKVQPAS